MEIYYALQSSRKKIREEYYRLTEKWKATVDKEIILWAFVQVSTHQ